MIERIRSVRIRRAPLGWAVLAGAGAGFFAGAAVIVLVTLVYRLFGVAPESFLPRATDLGTAVAVGVALSVARAAGGRVALAINGALIVLTQILALLTHVRFCSAIEQGPSSCSFFGYVLGLWPYLLGGALAYALVRRVASTDGTANPLLEVAGALGLTQGVFFGLLSFLFIATSELAAGLLQLVVLLGAGLACGLVLLARVEPSRQWRTLAIVALVALGEWAIVSLAVFMGQLGIAGKISVNALTLVALFGPLFEIGAAALVLYMAAARRVTATAPGPTVGTT